MKIDSRDLSLIAAIGALYAGLVIVQGLSAAATIQLRIADCLIVLCSLLGWPAILGVTLGCFVSNTYTSATLSNGVYDVFLGPLANLIAGTLIYVARKRRLAGCVSGAVAIGLIVGSYVWMIFTPPSAIFGIALPTNWPIWTLSVVSITTSSLVAIAIVGYILLTILSRSTIIEPLKSKGLKVASQD